MLPPRSQYNVQKTIVPTKYNGKDTQNSVSGKDVTAKGRTVRFRSICEEFDVIPSRESSPVCEIERENLPVGSDVLQQLLKEFQSTDESADDSAVSETESASKEARPKKSILKRRQVTRICRKVPKGKCKK